MLTDSPPPRAHRPPLRTPRRVRARAPVQAQAAAGAAPAAASATHDPLEGVTDLHGFEVIKTDYIAEFGSAAALLRHKKTGAELVSVSNDDENKVRAQAHACQPRRSRSGGNDGDGDGDGNSGQTGARSARLAAAIACCVAQWSAAD